MKTIILTSQVYTGGNDTSWTHHCWVSIRKAGSTLDVPHIHSEPVEPVAVVAASVGSQQKFRLEAQFDFLLFSVEQKNDRPGDDGTLRSV